jgi:Tfp pilus assembly protein PilN
MKAVNLLPSEQRGSAKTTAAAAPSAPGGSAFGAYVVLGVLAFAVAAFAMYTLAGNVIKDRKSELARVTQEATATQAQAAALQSYADFKTLATQRVATVKGLATARFDWERTLGDLSRAVPSDVHLTSLDGSVGTEVNGGGSSGLRGAVQAPSLELQGCSKTQSSVAAMMSRLRNVRGVTRVTLSKSDKDASTPTSVGSAGDEGTPAQLCPKGAPPAFDVLVFFERAAVSPNAAPNSTSTTAPKPGSPAAAAAAVSTATPAPGAAAAATPSPTTSTQTTQGVSAK